MPHLLRLPGGFSCGSVGVGGRASLGSVNAQPGRDTPSAAPRFADHSPVAPLSSRADAAAYGSALGSLPGSRSGPSGRRKRGSEASRDSVASRGPATAAGFADDVACGDVGDDGACLGASDDDEQGAGWQDATAPNARRESEASAGGADAAEMQRKLARFIDGLGVSPRTQAAAAAPAEAVEAEAPRQTLQLPARAPREALSDAVDLIMGADADDEAEEEDDEQAPGANMLDAGLGAQQATLSPGLTPRGLAPAPPPGLREDAAFETPPPQPPRGAVAAAAAAAAATAAAKSALGPFFSARRSGTPTVAADALLMPPPPPPPGAEGATPVSDAALAAVRRRGASPRVASPVQTVTPTASAAIGSRGGGHTQS